MVRRFAREDPAMASSTVTSSQLPQATAAEPRLPAAARTALAGRVRRGGTTGRARDRRAGQLRRALRRPGRGGRDPLPQLRVRTGVPAHVPRPHAHRPGLRAPLVRTRTRGARRRGDARARHEPDPARMNRLGPQTPYEPYDTHDRTTRTRSQNHEESDVLRRAFMTGGGATVAAASLGPLGLAFDAAAADRPRPPRRYERGGRPGRGRPQDPAARRPARRRRPLPARGGPAARRLRPARRGHDPAVDRRPAALGRR